jgi:hypothetical protein
MVVKVDHRVVVQAVVVPHRVQVMKVVWVVVPQVALVEKEVVVLTEVV